MLVLFAFVDRNLKTFHTSPLKFSEVVISMSGLFTLCSIVVMFWFGVANLYCSFISIAQEKGSLFPHAGEKWQNALCERNISTRNSYSKIIIFTRCFEEWWLMIRVIKVYICVLIIQPCSHRHVMMGRFYLPHVMELMWVLLTVTV